MSLLELILLLVVAGICGAIGKAIVGYFPGGFFVSIGVGFIGALLGTWMARGLGLPELFALRIGTTTFPIVWSILGSTLFVGIVALLTRRRYAARRWT
jgi:uncharacterized membrane protein YeaQ/YmgE (transglycosylase-associated protein family)